MAKERSIDDLYSLLSRVQTELPLRCSATKNLLENLPDWFQELGTDAGIAKLEAHLKAEIPEPLRLFYRFPATGCWLCAHYDTDIFLVCYSSVEKLHVVTWYYRPHFVLAEFSHSQTIVAVQLNSDNPRIEWGDDGSQQPSNLPPVFFVDWLNRIASDLIKWQPT